MKVALAYGREGLEAEVPDDALVLLPVEAPPLPDPEAAVRHALAAPIGSPPLRDLARGGRTATIVVSDVTRPVPNRLLLPPLLDELYAAGIARDAVTVLIATGLHRPATADELDYILGRDLARTARIVNHDARDRRSLARCGRSSRGTEIWLNRAYVEADVRILTGFVEPHIFAGYSGGGKAVLPGIAGVDTVMSNHGAAMLAHPNATWCRTKGNPVFEEMREVAVASRPTFVLNVTLTPEKEITGVYAGDLVAAHDAGIARAEAQAVRPIPYLFDVVVATNMGFPADINLYQSVKGMAAARQATAPDGHIVLVAECREGLGGEEYVDLLRSEPTSQALLDKLMTPGFAVHDQWGVQCLVLVQQAVAGVHLYSSMSREMTEAARVSYVNDVSETVRRLCREAETRHRRPARVCVLPHGHLTIPWPAVRTA